MENTVFSKSNLRNTSRHLKGGMYLSLSLIQRLPTISYWFDVRVRIISYRIPYCMTCMYTRIPYCVNNLELFVSKLSVDQTANFNLFHVFLHLKWFSLWGLRVEDWKEHFICHLTRREELFISGQIMPLMNNHLNKLELIGRNYSPNPR